MATLGEMGAKMMAGKSAFRGELEDAVLERHCANHPMTEKWAKGELGIKTTALQRIKPLP